MEKLGRRNRKEKNLGSMTDLRERIGDGKQSLRKEIYGKMSSIIEEAKVFEVQEEVIDLLLDTENDIREEPLPYPIIFLDLKLDVEDSIVKNREIEPKYLRGLLLQEMEKGEVIGYSNLEVKKEGVFDVPIKFGIMKRNNDSNFVWGKNNRNLNKFVVNFLDFINNPDVEWVEDSENYEMPSDGGSYVNCPYCGQRLGNYEFLKNHIENEHPNRKPERRTCELSGKTKRYVEKYSKLGKEAKRDVRRHWVRGHWRHFPKDSEYWTEEKRGTKTWIPPHTRGEGILVPKKYKVES